MEIFRGWEKDGGVSKLTLTMLKDDEGNYSCRSNGFESDAVSLQVVSEELEEGKRFVKSNLFCVITWWVLIKSFSPMMFILQKVFPSLFVVVCNFGVKEISNFNYFHLKTNKLNI